MTYTQEPAAAQTILQSVLSKLTYKSSQVFDGGIVDSLILIRSTLMKY